MGSKNNPRQGELEREGTDLSKSTRINYARAFREAVASPPAWGIGLRNHHFHDLEKLTTLPLLEILTDNLMFHRGGPAVYFTSRLAERTPVVMHGVGMNLGGVAPLDWEYLTEVKRLAEIYKPRVLSDHLAFTHTGKIFTYELLPVHRTQRMLEIVVEKVNRAQDFLQRQLSIENISAYCEYEGEMGEGEFFSELVAATGCGIMFDVNNLYVNAFNFSRDIEKEISAFPLDAITQIHLAGHEDKGDYLFDTHDRPVIGPVKELFWNLMGKLQGEIPCVLEWDGGGVGLEVVMDELQRVAQLPERAKPRDLLELSSRAKPRDLPELSSRAKPRDLLELSSRAKPRDLLASSCISVDPSASLGMTGGMLGMTGGMLGMTGGPQESLALEVTSFAQNEGRIHIYQQSFRGRVVSALAETVLEPACNLFGKDLIKEIVARYFAQVKPQTSCMVKALGGIEKFLVDASGDVYARWIGKILQMCLKRWELLHGEDPHESFPYEFVENEENLNLYQSWVDGIHNTIQPLSFYQNQPAKNVWMVKTSPIELTYRSS